MLARLAFAISAILLAVPPTAVAQTWPTRPVRVVIPFSAGGAVDVMARLVFDKVSASLGQPFIIENRVGGGGTIGAAAVAKAEADGYTILVHSSSHSVAPALYSKLAYDATKDFSAVVALGVMPTALFVSADKGYKDVKDFVGRAKASPGSMSYGSGGVGNATHLNAERFNLSAGVKSVHVPFKGSPEALTEVLAGRIDYSFSTLLPALPLLQSGKLQALAVTSPQRSVVLPGVPTTLEAGYPESDYIFWIGALVRKGTSQAVIDSLYRESEKALAQPDVQAKMKTLGAELMPMTTAKFDKLISDEVDMNKALVKAAGIPTN